LPPQTLALIRDLDHVEGNPYVFVGRFDGTHLKPAQRLQKTVQAESGVADFHFHAIRHTVETKIGDLKVLPHIYDLVLGHAPNRGAHGRLG